MDGGSVQLFCFRRLLVGSGSISGSSSRSRTQQGEHKTRLLKLHDPVAMNIFTCIARCHC